MPDLLSYPDVAPKAWSLPVNDPMGRDRAALNITISAHAAEVDTSQRWEHRIRFRDEATPTSRAKPDGVRGAEIWCAFGPVPPASPADCTYLATDTATPYLAVIDPGKAGQTAHYLARWVTTRGETGPWSETVSATVTG